MEHLHYGRKILPLAETLREPLCVPYGTDVIYDRAFDPNLSLLHLGLELSPSEKGDFRKGALALSVESGSPVCDLRFSRAEILSSPPVSSELPTVRQAGECLALYFQSAEGLEAQLYYIPLEQCDVIVRQMRLVNHTGGPVTLHRALSYQLDIPRQDMSLIWLIQAQPELMNDRKPSD